MKIIKLNKSNVERQIEYFHSVVVYKKYLAWLGEMIIFSTRLEYYQFSKTLWIFLINGNTIYVNSIFKIKTAKCTEHDTSAVFYFFLLNLSEHQDISFI